MNDHCRHVGIEAFGFVNRRRCPMKQLIVQTIGWRRFGTQRAAQGPPSRFSIPAAVFGWPLAQAPDGFVKRLIHLRLDRERTAAVRNPDKGEDVAFACRLAVGRDADLVFGNRQEELGLGSQNTGNFGRQATGMLPNGILPALGASLGGAVFLGLALGIAKQALPILGASRRDENERFVEHDAHLSKRIVGCQDKLAETADGR